MTTQEISEKLKPQFPDAIVEVKIEGTGDPFIKVTPGKLKDIAAVLRNDPDMKFDFLMCLSGMDYGKSLLGVVYQFYSMTIRHRVTIKTEITVEKPEVPTVSDIWPSAGWHEREAYDLIGVRFTGHPDLRRILLPEDYPGHPLRKDFKVPEFYMGMKVPY